MNLRDPSNPLPPQMKADTAEIARFVFARTYRAAETMDRALLPSLAGINRQLAAGLRGLRLSDAATEAPAAGRQSPGTAA